MIRPCDASAPAFVYLVEEKMAAVERTLRTPSMFLGTITGGIHIVAGTTAAVYALAVALFFKISHHIPMVSEEKKVRWSTCKGVESSMHLFRNSITMIVLGLIQTLPILGGIALYCAYKFRETDAKMENIDGEIKVAQSSLEVISAKVNRQEENLQGISADIERIKKRLSGHSETLSLLASTRLIQTERLRKSATVFS